MSDVVERAQAALATGRAQGDVFYPRGLLSELVAEVEKWRTVALELDATTPDELDTAIRILGYSIDIGEWGQWGIYALEGLFEDLGILPGDNYPEAVARVRGQS